MVPHHQINALAMLDGWLVGSYNGRNWLVPPDLDWASNEIKEPLGGRGRYWLTSQEPAPADAGFFPNWAHLHYFSTYHPPRYFTDADAVFKIVLKLLYEKPHLETPYYSELSVIIRREKPDCQGQWETEYHNALTAWRIEAILKATKNWTEDPRLSGKTFEVFIGNQNFPPFILTEETEKKRALIPLSHLLKLPIEYRESFEHDIVRALREIGGVNPGL